MPRSDPNGVMTETWGVASRNLRTDDLHILGAEDTREKARNRSRSLNRRRNSANRKRVRYIPVRLDARPS